MRIEALAMEAFRGVQEKRTFIFPSADVIVLYGPNGFGKTSFFDAIEWGLTGRIYRFEDDTERKQYRFIGNHFSGETKPSVTIELRDRENRHIQITRTGTAESGSKTDSMSSKLQIFINGIQIADNQAENQLHSLLINEDWQKHVDLNKSLFLTHLLCQERMNGILRGMKENERYDSVSALFGTDQFQRYRQLFHETKKRLEQRHTEAKGRKAAIDQQLGIMEQEYNRLREEIRLDEGSGTRKNISAMLGHYAHEYGCDWKLDDGTRFPEIMKQLVRHLGSSEVERERIRQKEKRNLELAEAALLSWKKNEPDYRNVSRIMANLEILRGMDRTLKRLARLVNELERFQNSEETKQNIILLMQKLSRKVEEEKKESEQLELARDHFRKALEDAREQDERYSSLQLSFLREVNHLDSELRTSFLDVMRQVEDSHHVRTEQAQMVQAAHDHYQRCQNTAHQLEMREEQYRQLLQHVFEYASIRPDTHECPACGTQSVDAEHLLSYVEKKRNDIHPGLAATEEEVSKAHDELKAKEAFLKIAKDDFQLSLGAAEHFLEQKDEQLLQSRQFNLRTLKQIDLYQKEMDIMDQSYEEFRNRLREFGLETGDPTVQEELDKIYQTLHAAIEEKLSQLPGMELETLPGKLAECEALLAKFQDEQVLFKNRLKDAGLDMEEGQEPDFEALQEQMEFMAQEQEQRISRLNEREAKILQIQEAYRTDTSVSRLQALEGLMTGKRQEIADIVEEMNKWNSYIEIAHEAMQKVPEAVNDLNEKVMDQMFDTMRSIFVRVNSHPLFTEMDYDTDKKYNNNRLFLTVMTDDIPELRKQANPAYIFSAAQVNATAISFFLAMALRQQWSPLEFIAMDDPVQSMDDLNVAALIDLIRMLADPQSKTKKQFIISTHDATFYQLMRKKFRMLNVGLIEYESYSEKGPLVSQRFFEASPKKTILLLAKPEQ